LPSERNKHFMTEVSHPLGVVGVISAFNFPIAVSTGAAHLSTINGPPTHPDSLPAQVFGWNFSLAFITGNASIWKPSETTPLCGLATTKIITSVLEAEGYPGALCGLMVGGGKVGAALVESKEVDLVSFTGSEARGRTVGAECAMRFKQSLLELGGNNVSVKLDKWDPSY
jgi:aldehyde dehydrogenase family 7 protein A1